MAFDKALHMS